MTMNGRPERARRRLTPICAAVLLAQAAVAQPNGGAATEVALDLPLDSETTRMGEPQPVLEREGRVRVGLPTVQALQPTQRRAYWLVRVPVTLEFLPEARSFVSVELRFRLCAPDARAHDLWPAEVDDADHDEAVTLSHDQRFVPWRASDGSPALVSRGARPVMRAIGHGQEVFTWYFARSATHALEAGDRDLLVVLDTPHERRQVALDVTTRAKLVREILGLSFSRETREASGVLNLDLTADARGQRISGDAARACQQ